MIRNQKSYEDAPDTALFNGMSVSSRKTSNQSYKRESFHYTSHQPSPGNLQDGMSLPGTNSLPLTATAAAPVPSAANALSQHPSSYLTGNTLSGSAAHISAATVNYLNPHASVTSTQSALSLSSHSQGPTPASTPPAVPNDTKGPTPYLPNYVMNHSLTYRPMPQGHQVYVGNNPRGHTPRGNLPIQHRPYMVFSTNPAASFSMIAGNPIGLPNNNTTNLVATPAPFQMPTSTSTEQHQNMYYAAAMHAAAGNAPSQPYPSYPISRSTWTTNARSASQNIVPMQPTTPMVQTQQLSYINSGPSIQQQPPAQSSSKTKKRPHALPIIHPDTGEEIVTNEEKVENENKLNSMKNKETIELDKKVDFSDSKSAPEPSSNYNPSATSLTYTNKEQTSSTVNGAVTCVPFASPSEWKPSSLNNANNNFNSINESVDLANSMKSSNIPSLIPLKVDYKKPTREEPNLAVSEPVQPLDETKSRERPNVASWPEVTTSVPVAITASSQVFHPRSGSNVTKKISKEPEKTVSDSPIGSLTPPPTNVTTISSLTVSSDGLKATSVTNNSVVLDDTNDGLSKKMTKQGIQSGTVVPVPKDTLSSSKLTTSKPPVSTASSHPLSETSQASLSAGGPLPAQVSVTKSDVKSQPFAPAQHPVSQTVSSGLTSSGVKPPTTALHTSGPISEKPSPLLSQSTSFPEPFPSKSSAATVAVSQSSVEKAVSKEEKSNPSITKTKNRGKEPPSENAYVDHPGSNAKGKNAQSLPKHHNVDIMKSANSSTPTLVSSKPTNGEAAELTPATEGKSKKKKASKKDLNKKGSEKEGSEMDMFTNIDKAQAQVPPEKTTRTEKITQSNSSQNVSVNANTNNRSKSNSSQKNVSDVKENVNSAVDSKEKFTNIPSTSPVPNVSQADKNNKTDDRNADGSKCTKKRYTVNFMLNLRDEPQCKVKVQLECNSALLFPSVGGGGRSSQNGCFLPAFAAPNHPQNVSSLPTRKSTSIGRRDKPNQIHYSLSLREEVPLRRAKDAWKPAIFSQDAKNLSDEEKKSEALYKSVRGILNKLTPEKFPALIVKFKALEIDTAPRLREVIKLIFQKAIDEPGFCKWYAEMCQEMQHLTLPEETGEKPISFRILLLNQCQAQFERDKAAELDSVTKKSEIDACTNPEKKKELQLLFEENERKNRRKSVGNCRFIGELFKHKMLTSKIMMNCIRQLLTQIEEESLECLCKLLTTIGKDLDTKASGTQSSKELDPFFKKMQDIAEKKTYKVSSRIRFMLLDVIELRRNHWVPRRETDNPKTIGEMNSEMEKKEYEQKMQAAIATRKSYDDYGNRGRDNKRNRNDRQSNDEWQTVTKSNMAKPNYKLDPSKFSSLTQSSQDTEASLGPPSFNVWRSGAGASVKSSDKKSMSSSMHVPDRLSVTSSRGSSSGKLTPSTSMERSKPFPASRETDALKMSRSGSVQNVHPVSRESSVPRAAPPRTASQTAAPPPSNVPTELSEEELKRCSATILKEYYVSKDLEDSLAAFAERFNPNQVTKVFEEFIYMVLEDPKLAEPCGKLTAALLKKKSVSLSHIISALSRIIEAAGDIVIDYPRMWEYITDMLSVIFIQDCLQYNEFEAALLKQHPNECDHALLSAVKTKLMDSRANATSNESSPADTSDQNHIYKFLLEKLTNDAFESTSKWIDENFGNSRHNSEVVVAITEAVCEILYQKINTNRDFQKEVDDAFSKKFRNLFKKYIENEEKLEIDCLKTIERFAKKNQFPNGFLLKLFMALYESKSISHESFVQWKTMKGEAEHGVAVSSLRTFYEYLAEEREPQLNTNESS